jgi:hypothetical protein
MEAIRAEGVIHYEEVVVFRGLFFLGLLGGLFGVFFVGLAGLAGHGASWYDGDETWEAIRS